jgi:tripartite ATP-independent transporter DctP family solute receptor
MTRRRFLSTMTAGAAGMAWLATGRAPAFAQRKSFPARFGTVLSATSPNSIADKFFADEANKRSQGGLQIQFFPDAQIGASRDLLEGVQLGTIQFAEVSTANITPFLADTMVFDLPYVFTNQPQLLKFLDGPIGSQRLAIERFATINMRGLCWFDTGTRKIYNSKKPIVTPADLKGMKIRVEENPVRVASFNAMGAQATAMSFNQVYGALQQGVVEGAENSELTYMTNRHNEVAPYLSNTDHFITPNCIAVSTAFFNGLPKDLQEVLIQAGKDTAAFERKIWAEAEAKLAADMKAAGVKVNDSDKKAFKAMVGKLQEEYAQKIPKEWWDVVMKAAA